MKSSVIGILCLMGTLLPNFYQAQYSIWASEDTICPGDTIQYFTNYPSNQYDSINWYFPGANPNYSSSHTGSINFNTQGNYYLYANIFSGGLIIDSLSSNQIVVDCNWNPQITEDTISTCSNYWTTVQVAGYRGTFHCIESNNVITSNGYINSDEPSGYYTIVHTLNNQTDTAIVEIFNPDISFNILTSPMCNSNCNGVATINPINSPAPIINYFYNSGWTSPNWSGDTITDICAGYLTYSIEDTILQCTFHDSIQIIPAIDYSINSTVTNSSCPSVCDGTVSITASPASQYTYTNLNLSSNNTTGDFTNLCGSTYHQFLIEDTNGCSQHQYIYVGTTNNQPQINQDFSITTTSNDCQVSGPSGSALVTTSTTQPNWTYSIDQDSLFSTNQNFTSLNSGSHTLYINIGSGCVYTYNFSINTTNMPNSELSGTSNRVNCIGSDIWVYAAQDTSSAYDFNLFSINGGPWQISPQFTLLQNGFQTIQAIDQFGCAHATTVPTSWSTVNNYTLSSDTICPGETGIVTINSNISNQSLYSLDTINWSSSNEFTSSSNGLTVYIQDEFCIQTHYISPSTYYLYAGTDTLLSFCPGLCDGLFVPYAHGGTGNYTMSFDGSPFIPLDTITDLCPGTYTYIISDGVCKDTSYILMDSVSNAYTSAWNSLQAGCDSSCTGQLTVWPNYTQYTYSTDSVTWQSSNVFDSLCPGSYTYFINNGTCSLEGTGTVNAGSSNLGGSILTTDANCNQNTGSATVNPWGGSGQYAYNWGLNSSNQSTQTATNLFADTYIVTVTDLVSACTWNGTAIVEDNCPPGIISGNVSNDFNGNCQYDNGEFFVSNIAITAQPGNYTTWTDVNGNYQFNLPTGNYTISHYTSNPNTQLTCQTIQNVSLSNGQIVNNVDFYVQEDTCADPYVSLFMGQIIPCDTTYIYLDVSNYSNSPIPNATVQVYIPDGLTYLGGNFNLINQNGNYYTFDFASLSSYSWESIGILVAVDCDPILNGVTLCSEATLTGNNICPSDSNELYAYYTQEASPCLVIKNLGQHTINSNYEIYDNTATPSSIDFTLAPGDSLIDCSFNIDSIVDININTGHWNGNSPVTIGTMPGNLWNMFSPSTNAIHWISNDCSTVGEPYDPNMKEVSPKGATWEHITPENALMDYKIHFQNTGTSPAINVFIDDTISDHLDMSTINIIGASHPVYMQTLPDRTIRFRFDQIILPDSNSNEPASHGFVRYIIKQKSNLPIGTEIFNSASIFFDFNAPIYTNFTHNKIGRMDQIETGIKEQEFKMNIYPNPTDGIINIEIPDDLITDSDFRVYDITGKIVSSVNLDNSISQLDIYHLSAGLYIWEIYSNNRILKRGKIEKQ